MVVRIAGLAYQKGFGGHFHNDDAVAVLRDIPGWSSPCPARPDDAAAMLRTCLAAADVDGSVCVFLEPIALYHERDLYEPGDGGWLAGYEPPDQWARTHVPIGRGPDLWRRQRPDDRHVRQRAADEPARGPHAGRRGRQLPGPRPALAGPAAVRGPAARGRRHRARAGRRRDQAHRRGVGEGVITALVDAGFTGRIARVASEDSFVPLGDAAAAVLLSEHEVAQAARDLLR